MTNPRGMIINHFNKPEQILFAEDGSASKYSYDAAGNKVQDLIFLNDVPNRTDYVGNFIYRNNSLSYRWIGNFPIFGI